MGRLDRFDRPVAVAGTGDEQTVYRSYARRLGLPFATTVSVGPDRGVDLETIRRGAVAMTPGGSGTVYIAPTDETLPEIAHLLLRHPRARSRVAVAPPSAIRAALTSANAERLTAAAITHLADRAPRFSARATVTSFQLLLIALASAGLAAAFYRAPHATGLVLNLLGVAFFLGVTMLRVVAARRLDRRQSVDLPEALDEELPVYTILVPLYRETPRVVAELIAALDEIDWPRDRLDIKLLVEADDGPTRRAAEAFAGGPPYEVIAVPAIGPRTKPKALAFAQGMARGDFLTIYDAEDRPHPGQLREAYATFRLAGPEVACLQAPIVIDNRRASLVARLFAVEYSALFDGLLPALAEIGLPLPLGGTSNHFRRAFLDAVGGWDPFNVTEDADLGIRLARCGLRSATLTLPTYEEAPVAIGQWLGQRARWFKGWLQTWLVHTREPVRLARELGFRQLVGFNLVGIGMLISALIHPIFLSTLVAVAISPRLLWDGHFFDGLVISANLVNLFAGYIGAAALAGRTLALRGHGEDAVALLGLPLYWLLMWVACVKAIIELVRRPHHWQKTTHRGRGP